MARHGRAFPFRARFRRRTFKGAVGVAGDATWAFDATATGAIVGTGTGAGSWAFAASGDGTAAGATASAVGAASWALTAAGVGAASLEAGGVGSWAFTGAGAASATGSATGAGPWAFTGAGTGRATAAVVGGGSWAFGGLATPTAPVVPVAEAIAVLEDDRRAAVAVDVRTVSVQEQVMSVNPGAVLYKDPDAVLVYAFDWAAWLGVSATIATSTFTVEGADALLTQDQASIVSGGQSARVRLTGGTVGKDYTLAHRIVTNETPTQTDERTVTIRIKQR